MLFTVTQLREKKDYYRDLCYEYTITVKGEHTYKIGEPITDSNVKDFTKAWKDIIRLEKIISDINKEIHHIKASRVIPYRDELCSVNDLTAIAHMYKSLSAIANTYHNNVSTVADQLDSDYTVTDTIVSYEMNKLNIKYRAYNEERKRIEKMIENFYDEDTFKVSIEFYK